MISSTDIMIELEYVTREVFLKLILYYICETFVHCLLVYCTKY